MPTRGGADVSVAEAIARDPEARGRYLIDKEVARGGMGVVLRGIDRDIRRDIAVKVMLDDRNAAKKTRFVEEAQITGQLEHPNIVPVHELGLDEQKRPYFTMKMVKGRSLAEILKEKSDPRRAAKDGDWPLARLLSIFVNVCHALSYAHSRWVIHRDLKPANIMVGDFGEVYVMDWGLAKVLVAEPALSPSAVPSRGATSSTGFEPSQASSSGASSEATGVLTGSSVETGKISTIRRDGAELTLDGSVLGTPAYMSPEQALGRIREVDRRSDIYALGGLLYAMLTLQPPVEKGGGQAALLRRVAQGEIKKPEERSPERHIPPELSAIAMKALALRPGDRYQTVEALQRDVELFQEGRSVSAKQDSFKEQVWKLVKRNKGASVATAAMLVVLLLFSWYFLGLNYRARVQAEENYAEYVKEAERRRGAIPSFMTAAAFLVEKQDFGGAGAQVGLVLEIEPGHLEARFLRGQIAMVEQEYDRARVDLDAYAKARPEDALAKDLLAFLPRAKADDPARQVELVELFRRHEAFGMAVGVGKSLGADSGIEVRQKMLETYRKGLEKSWPGRGDGLSLDKDGMLHLKITEFAELTDLAPLKGMPLTSLGITRCPNLSDVSAIRTTPLKALSIAGPIPVDLAVIRSLPLKSLTLYSWLNLTDLSPLKGLQLSSLDLSQCRQLSDLSPLRGMPLSSLNLSSCNRLSDLSPLRGMALSSLNLSNCNRLSDLAPLRGMPLSSLNLSQCRQLSDLSPLRGLPLSSLYLSNCSNLSDLSPLRGMEITSLNLTDCKQLSDLSPLQGMPLSSLDLTLCKEVSDLSPLRGMPLTNLDLDQTKVSDLTPLKGLKLRQINFPLKTTTRGLDALRAMPTLRNIAFDSHHYIPAAEFWKRYDAGELK